jgi:hypothetical protein
VYSDGDALTRALLGRQHYNVQSGLGRLSITPAPERGLAVYVDAVRASARVLPENRCTNVENETEEKSQASRNSDSQHRHFLFRLFNSLEAQWQSQFSGR